MVQSNLHVGSPLVSDHLPKRPPIQNSCTKTFPVKALQLEPLVNDHLLLATATTSHKRPLIQNTKTFTVKALQEGLNGGAGFYGYRLIFFSYG